jgi:cell division septum initiation protein DivIVA
MGTKAAVLRNLTSLLSCERDEHVVATLLDIKERVAAMPDQHVSKDLNTVLHLLVDVKNDNAQLWAQIVQLKDQLDASNARIAELEGQLDASKARIAELEGTVSDLKAIITTQGYKLAMRQVLHALNEKLLRRAAAIAAPGLTLAQFWSKYKVRNIGQMKCDPVLLTAWRSMSDDLELLPDPRDFWEDLKDLKSDLDAFVHDGSFPRMTFNELTEAAEKSLEDKDRYAFLDMLRLSAKLGGSLYDY